MRRTLLIVFSTLVLLVRCFAQVGPATPGSIRGEVVTKNQNGEPAVLAQARIVLHGPLNKEAQSDAQGAFAIDGLPPGTYNIEASAPGLTAALIVDVKPGKASVVPIELTVAVVTNTVTVTASEPSPIEESAQKTTI